MGSIGTLPLGARLSLSGHVLESLSLRSQTLAEAASITDRLRRDILNGEFVPGERLIELTLTERYSAGRAVVREALIELEAEELVEREANRGATVRAISLSEVIQITEARIALETLIARDAAGRCSDADRLLLREIESAMVSAIEHDDLADYSAQNTRLHAAVRTIGANCIATSLVENLLNRSSHHQFRLAFQPGRTDHSLPEHQAIIKAICMNDPDQASSAMCAHLESALETLRDWTDTEIPDESAAVR